MPRRDGTGPMGMGAGTGRGRGNCSKGIKRGFGLAIGMGLGLGLGLKRGFRNFWRLNQNKEDELKELKTQAEVLEQGLSKVKDRITELENQEGE